MASPSLRHELWGAADTLRHQRKYVNNFFSRVIVPFLYIFKISLYSPVNLRQKSPNLEQIARECFFGVMHSLDPPL